MLGRYLATITMRAFYDEALEKKKKREKVST